MDLLSPNDPRPLTPVLLAFKGLPACGKTTLARAVGCRLRWPILSKDAIDDLLDAVSERRDYSPLSHHLMFGWAASLLQQELSVICDTTLMGTRSLDAARTTADSTGAALRIVEVVCSDDNSWRQRVEDRAGTTPSSRVLTNWQTFCTYRALVEPDTRYPLPNPFLRVDTATGTPEFHAARIVTFLSAQL